MRIQFREKQQEKFFNYVIQKTDLNLKKISKKMKIDYERMKKYKQEKCRIPENIFLRLCNIASINPENLDFSKYPDNLGQIIGGKKGISGMRRKYAKKLSGWRRKGGRNHFK